MLPQIDENTLVYLSRYFNKICYSLTALKNRQDSKFVTSIRKRAMEKMNGGKLISDPKGFFVGCVDFMVTNVNGEKKFVLLETNGGSSRGFLSLAEGQIEKIFSAYKDAIDMVSEWDHKKVVLIGTVVNDSLFQEKILLVEFLKQRYEIEGYKVGVYNSFIFNDEYRKKDEDISLIISNYNNILDDLSYKNQHITFKGVQVDVVIGDGVARRFPIIGAYIKHDWNKIKTLIINPIYAVSDDKANTYLAVKMGYDRLKPFRVHNLDFGKANDPYQLEKVISTIIEKSEKKYIIKPFGGSGGVGIQPISSSFSVDRASDLMEKSITEFYQKFDSRRTPFPYTFQEMADFSLIDWKNSKRTFDVRVYVIQKEGKIIPIGGEGRIAGKAYTGGLNKEEFVVNLSAYNRIDIERGVSLSEEGMKLMNLEEEDLVDMFCAASEIFHIIVENFSKIVNFTEWDHPFKPSEVSTQ